MSVVTVVETDCINPSRVEMPAEIKPITTINPTNHENFLATYADITRPPSMEFHLPLNQGK